MWVARTNKPEHYLASTPSDDTVWREMLLKSTINYQCHRVKLSWLLNHFCKVAEYYRNGTESSDGMPCDAGIDWVNFSVLFTLLCSSVFFSFVQKMMTIFGN